jgi:hypothetical protein
MGAHESVRAWGRWVVVLGGAAVAANGAFAAGLSPFAVEVVNYVAGTDPTPGYDNPWAALGSPERMTGESGGFPAAVTPFNSPWGMEEIVSIGAGGSLTLRFDTPIRNDPSNPYGVDLLVFGNGFFVWSPGDVAAGLAAEGPFSVSVSADGVNFSPVAGMFFDSIFPTLGYQDLQGAFDTPPGSVLTDFTRPMDPSLTPADFIGLDFAQIAALYGQSGGGISIDIASSGLSEAWYVRIEAASKVEIDAVSVTPEPATAAMLALAAAWFLRRGRA